MEASKDDLHLELKNHSKNYFRKKFFMKTYMEEMVKSKVKMHNSKRIVNPNYA